MKFLQFCHTINEFIKKSITSFFKNGIRLFSGDRNSRHQKFTLFTIQYLKLPQGEKKTPYTIQDNLIFDVMHFWIGLPLQNISIQ